MLLKVGIWPSAVISPSSAATTLTPFAQDRTQTHPHPLVDPSKRLSRAVLEVTEPPDQCHADRGDDLLKALSVRPWRLRSNALSELLLARRPRIAVVPKEPVPEKVEPGP